MVKEKLAKKAHKKNIQRAWSRKKNISGNKTYYKNSIKR
jgi:hypothetical protein